MAGAPALALFHSHQHPTPHKVGCWCVHVLDGNAFVAAVRGLSVLLGSMGVVRAGQWGRPNESRKGSVMDKIRVLGGIVRNVVGVLGFAPVESLVLVLVRDGALDTVMRATCAMRRVPVARSGWLNLWPTRMPMARWRSLSPRKPHCVRRVVSTCAP